MWNVIFEAEQLLIDIGLIKEVETYKLLMYSDQIANLLEEIRQCEFSKTIIELWFHVRDFIQIATSRRYALENGYCIK